MESGVKWRIIISKLKEVDGFLYSEIPSDVVLKNISKKGTKIPNNIESK